MKLNIRGLIVLLVLFLITLPSFLVAESPSLYVEVRQTKLRKSPQHWATAVENLRFGDKLEQLEAGQDWVKVRLREGVEGFVHQSALTNRKVVLSEGTQFEGALNDPSSVVLAGKGFNAEILSSYQATHQELDFTALTKLEQQRVSEQELRDFIQAGDLKGPAHE